MKQGRKLSVAERKHISKSVNNASDWLISKKESHMWVIIHRNTEQAKQVLAP